MAVSPPGDIVMDVLKAADPQEVRAARAALAEAGGRVPAPAGSADTRFDIALSDNARLSRTSAMEESPRSDNTYQQFEAMVLQNFVEAMLPQSSENYFGEGTSGEIWKGMMAEQLGRVLAEGGGVGIAESIAPARSAPKLSAAANLLNELERSTLGKLGGDGNTEPDTSKSGGLWG